MLNTAVRTIVAVAGGALLLTGCGGETSTAADEGTATSTCYPPSPIADAELAVFTDSLNLPAGVSVVTARTSTDSDHPDQVGVAIDLCVPGAADADALRPIASDIARALRPTPLGGRTFVLYVADMGPEYNTEAKVKDPAFQVHAWNGKPSQDAELAQWEVVGG